MTPTAYTVGAALAGALLMAATIFGLRFVDESFREHRWTCCVCRRTWVGVAKLCRCGARGHTDPPVEVRTPAHDFEGRCDTGPIPVVPAPRQAGEDEARHRLREEAHGG